MIKNKNEFEIKKEHIVEGITEDYVWYHSKLLLADMQSWQTKFEKIIKVMGSRHSEHLEMIKKLLSENHALRKAQEK